MEKELTNGLMEKSTQVLGRMDRNMGMANGQMEKEINMKEIGSKTKPMGRENTYGVLGIGMQEIGKIFLNMDLEQIIFSMGIPTQGSIDMGSLVVRVNTYGLVSQPHMKEVLTRE